MPRHDGTLQCKNFGALKNLLSKLPEKVGRKVLNRALMQAADPMYKEAVRTAPVDTGLLRESIKKGYGGIQNDKFNPQGRGRVYIKIAKVFMSSVIIGKAGGIVSRASAKTIYIGKGKKRKSFRTRSRLIFGPHIYGRLVHWGTKFMRPRPWLERAARTTAQATVDIFQNVLGPSYEKEAVKLGAKRGGKKK